MAAWRCALMFCCCLVFSNLSSSCRSAQIARLVRDGAAAGPNAYNVQDCIKFLGHFRPGLRPGTVDRQVDKKIHQDWKHDEQDVWNQLCTVAEAKSFRTPRPSIRGELLRAVIESTQFDFPGFDRIIISGYEVTGHLTLTKTKITNFVSLQNCVFHEFVDFSYVATDHNLDLTNSQFNQGLSLRGFKSTQSVLLDPYLDTNLGEGQPDKPPRERTQAQFIDLSLAHVDGVVAIGNLEGDYVNASGASIGQFFRIYSSDFHSISLLNLFTGSLNILNVDVKPNNIDQKSELYCDNSLAGIIVADSVILDRSSFYCPLDLSSAKIGGNLSFRGSLLSSLDITGSHVDGDLVGGPAVYIGLDKTNESKTTFLRSRWVGRGHLILDHAQVDVVRVPINRWFDMTFQYPEKAEPHPCTLANFSSNDLEHSGNFLGELVSGVANFISVPRAPSSFNVSAQDFRFNSFGPPHDCYDGDEVVNSNESKLPLHALKQFLLQVKYSPTEFDRISDLLRNRGQDNEARQIQVWKSGIERNQRFKEAWDSMSPWSFLAASSMTLSGILVGYGYHVEYSFFWALLFLCVGWLVFSRLNLQTNKNNPDISGKERVDYTDVSPFWYSFEMLAPIIRLREKHYDIDILLKFTRRYFYVHKINRLYTRHLHASWSDGPCALAIT